MPVENHCMARSVCAFPGSVNPPNIRDCSELLEADAGPGCQLEQLAIAPLLVR